jgi:hypothetical protein
MKHTVILKRHLPCLSMILLLASAGCAAPTKQQPTTVGPFCSIEWDKTSDLKVMGYQLTVINQSRPANSIVRFVPAHTTKVSCKDAGANHAGLWDVTVQSCYDKTTCGPPTEVATIHITSK